MQLGKARVRRSDEVRISYSGEIRVTRVNSPGELKEKIKETSPN
jgi:hypothetical protein